MGGEGQRPGKAVQRNVRRRDQPFRGAGGNSRRNRLIARPIGFERIRQALVEPRAVAGTMPAIIRIGIVRIRSTQDRQEPMPVEHRNVFVPARRGMPPEQVVMVDADLARRIVMPNVVEVGLRQRDMDQARDQQSDPEKSRTLTWNCPKSHRPAPIFASDRQS